MNNPRGNDRRDAGISRLKPETWRGLGCLFMALLFFLGPVLLMVSSNYVHVAGYGLAGLVIWFVLARSIGRKMAHRSLILPGILVISGLVALGLLAPYVSWLACPAWVTRQVVKRSDYPVMERIFGKPLPESFRITQTRYPGYNLVFNGPDGPLPAGYEIVVDAMDLFRLTQGLPLKEQKSEPGQWPGRSYDTLLLMNDLHNDMAEQYWRDGRLEEKILADKLKVFTLKKFGDMIWLSIDERTSPSLKVYVSTKIPYMRNPS